MFGLKHIGKIVLTSPPGITACVDGAYSTLSPGRGVCSRHNGFSGNHRQSWEPIGLMQYSSLVKGMEVISDKETGHQDLRRQTTIWGKKGKPIVKREVFQRRLPSGAFEGVKNTNFYKTV